MLGVRTDHAHDAAPMNDFALHADLLNRCSYFHFLLSLPALAVLLLVAIYNAAARQVIRRKLHGHAISRQDTYKILSHLPRNVG